MDRYFCFFLSYATLHFPVAGIKCKYAFVSCLYFRHCEHFPVFLRILHEHLPRRCFLLLQLDALCIT